MTHNKSLNRSGGWAQKLKSTSLAAARLAQSFGQKMNFSTFTGGSRVGRSYWMASNESFPFTTLELDSEHVELKTTLHGIIRLKRSEIEKITLGFYLMSFGLRVFHRRDNLPPYIVFWTLSPTKIRKAFEDLNWELEKK